MTSEGSATLEALRLIAGADPELAEIVLFSLSVSLTASILAFCIGVPLGGLLAVRNFSGKQPVLVIVNALLGMPPVVAGLAIYLFLSRSGPAGFLGLLFTPAAMVLAQTMLATPIVVALSHRVLSYQWMQYGDALVMTGASRARALLTLAAIGHQGLVTTFLSAFGRAISEVGAILIVGGNIRGYTRTMTTAIALETSKGEFALALGLGMVLISLTIGVSAVAFSLGRRKVVRLLPAPGQEASARRAGSAGIQRRSDECAWSVRARTCCGRRCLAMFL